MLVCPNMASITTLANNSRVRPHSTIGIQLMLAISLVIILALSALQTRVGLGADTDTLAFFDECYFRADAHCRSYDFYSAGSVYAFPLMIMRGKIARVSSTARGREKFGSGDIYRG